MYVSGDNSNSQLDNTTSDQTITPPRKSNLDISSLLSFSTAHNHSVWVDTNFNAHSSYNYQIDVKNNDNQPCKFVSAVCANNYTLYLVKYPGQNDKFQLLYEQNYRIYHFLNIGDRNPIALYGGYHNSAAIDSEGAILLFTRYDTALIKPVFLPNNDKAISIACCESFYIALGSGGKAYICNINNNSNPTFTLIDKLANKRFTSISGTNKHCFLVSNDGKVYGHGINECKCLGVEANSLEFGLIDSLSNFSIKAAFAGYNHSFFITSDGDSYACGYNDQSQTLINQGPNHNNICPPVLQNIQEGKATFYVLGYNTTVLFIVSNVPQNMPNKNIERFINEDEMKKLIEDEYEYEFEEEEELNIEERKEKVVEEVFEKPFITEEEIKDVPEEELLVTPEILESAVPKISYENILPTMKLHFDKPADDIDYDKLKELLGDDVVILDYERGSTILIIMLLSIDDFGPKLNEKYEKYAEELKEKVESPLGQEIVGNFVGEVDIQIPTDEDTKKQFNFLQTSEVNNEDIEDIRKEVLSKIKKEKSKFNWEYVFSQEEYYNKMEEQVRNDIKKNPYEMIICGQSLLANKYMKDLEKIKGMHPENKWKDRFLYHGTALINHPKILDKHFKDQNSADVKKTDAGYYGIGIYGTNNLYYASYYANKLAFLKPDDKTYVICCRAIYNNDKVRDVKDIKSYYGKPIDQDIQKSYGINRALVGSSAKFLPISKDQSRQDPVSAREYVFADKTQIVPFSSFTVMRKEYYFIWKDEDIKSDDNQNTLKELKKRLELNVYSVENNKDALEIIKNKKFATPKLVTNGGKEIEGKTLIEEARKIRPNIICLVYCSDTNHMRWISAMENVLYTDDPNDLVLFGQLEMKYERIINFMKQLQDKFEKKTGCKFNINKEKLSNNYQHEKIRAYKNKSNNVQQKDKLNMSRLKKEDFESESMQSTTSSKQATTSKKSEKSTRLPLEIIKQLPKAELHCHLDGYIRPQTVIDLAKEQQVQLPTTNIKKLKHLMTVPMENSDRPTYLRCFDVVNPVMQQPYAITRIFYEACEDAVADGISYIELRLAPALHTKKGYSCSQILEAAIEGCILAEEKLPIIARIICCATEINAQIADICWRYRHRNVVGFDLIGSENGFPTQKHIKAFQNIRSKSINVTIHADAGEKFGAKSVELALKCSCQRISNGTRIAEDQSVLDEVIDRRIALECCVSSNVQTKTVEKLEDHPIKKLYDLGVRVVPCTDNPTVSGVTLSGEYHLLQEKFNFTLPELMKMMDYSFRAAFVPESLKKRLRVEAFVKAIKVLQKNDIDISNLVEYSDYYAKLGLTVPPKFCPPAENPPLTPRILEQIPKCDIDCRFIGSVPLTLLWEFYQKLPDNEKVDRFDEPLPKFESYEEMSDYILNEDEKNHHMKGETLCLALLQSAKNIREGVKAILSQAARDKVAYLELTCCPLLHTKKLSEEDVLDVICDVCKQFNERPSYGITVKIVLNANIETLTPIQVQKVAEMCVQHEDKGVVGFMTTGEIDEDTMKYYEDTFDYLHDNFVPVTIFAGEKVANSVTCALNRGHARRISGGFKIAQSESLLNDVTSHNNAILVNPSKSFESADWDWDRSPYRSIFDFGAKIAFCSIHNTFSDTTRSQKLLKLAQSSGFDALSVLKIIDNTFASIFMHHDAAKTFRQKFWKRSLTILKKNNFKDMMDYTFFRE
ncbi:hypothetical protein M9Y10_014049 [Tritrichomonas musculus]|uniref:adenosine deaminase n=1 Tax=Tritrichomonas musculus TaxID=1915356 RepID=A0ABR2KYF6_9EUKA